MGSDLPRGVGRPARCALAEAGYTRLEQLTAVRETEILKLQGVGPKAVGEIRRALAEKGMSFANVRKIG
jgi:DNA-directed RNA polymerase alpha subunit